MLRLVLLLLARRWRDAPASLMGPGDTLEDLRIVLGFVSVRDLRAWAAWVAELAGPPLLNGLVCWAAMLSGWKGQLDMLVRQSLLTVLLRRPARVWLNSSMDAWGSGWCMLGGKCWSMEKGCRPFISCLPRLKSSQLRLMLRGGRLAR